MKVLKSFMPFLLFILLLSFTIECPAEELTLEKITDNLYMIMGGGGNVAFLVTEEGVLVVDSKTFPYQGEEVVDKIRQVTDKEIKYLIYTHYHGDHVQGGQSFPQSALFVAHANTAKNMETLGLSRIKSGKTRYQEQLNKIEKKVETLRAEKSPKLKQAEEELSLVRARAKVYERLQLVFPEMTFHKKSVIYLGGNKVKLIYLGGGHTNGDILVYFPQEKVIHMGDLLFNNIVPYIDRSAGSDTGNWINILKKVAEMEKVEKVIPGHGELTDKKGLLALADYLSDLRAEVKGYIEQGATLEEIKKKISLPKYQKMEGYSRRLSANVEAVYEELTAKK
jgi:cyclase